MDSHKKTIISCRNSENASKIKKKNSGNFATFWVHGSITLYKIRWFYDLPRMHYTKFSALFATALRAYYIFTWISLRKAWLWMGIFLTIFGESHFEFLKVSEVSSRGNRSMIDSRQAIFSLNVVIFSNNYKRWKIIWKYGYKLQRLVSYSRLFFRKFHSDRCTFISFSTILTVGYF